VPAGGFDEAAGAEAAAASLTLGLLLAGVPTAELLPASGPPCPEHVASSSAALAYAARALIH